MNNRSSISAKIRELIKSNGFRTRDFIQKMKFNEGRFNSYLYNKADWDIEILKIISNYFNVSMDYLTGLRDVQISDYKYTENSKFVNIPVFGNVYCGSPVPQWDISEVKEYLTLSDLGKYKYLFALIAKGDSMSPYINPGDYLICADKPELIKDGKAVVVVFKGTHDHAEVNAKLLRLDHKRSLITLYSVNTKHHPQVYNEEEILKIYKLIRIIREVK